MKLKIAGMTCGHCSGAVEKALTAVVGVDSVDVNLEDGEATVNGSASVDQLIAAVKEEGYEAQEG